ncbi:glycosyltransferase [Clostridium tertium]|uniref:glycosyltransferase family 4 protein n=1 Tax=Clostridium tertium TaxID=1559 RepID=UPI00232F484E|nr:glycosyltransferase [Clostridium tertium]MDB1921735.1 glycosyltransferase [Clostridium tertium]MDB1924938.1 glycosyltransferase [Clostridium tertium]MDB1929577.1 glycosyltransferase [Clostridium tertium]
MKILMIGPFPGQINGMTLANKMVSEGLIENGNELEIVITNEDKESKSKSFGGLKQQGKFNLSKVLWSLKPILLGCYKILFKKFDVIYITPAQSFIGFMKYVPFIKASKLSKTCCYLHFHGGFVRKMYDSVSESKKKVVSKYLNMSTGIIVLGHSLIKMFDNIVPKEKVFVCENGVQKEYLLSYDEFLAKQDRMKESKSINILYLSNLMKTKGILELLDACKIMKDKNINFKLNIAGAIEADIESDFNEKLSQLKGVVEYHGLIKGKKKRDLLIKSDIFCLPTYYPNEGQPISILEAMITGNAIVTTYQGGICDIFKDKLNGCVCEAKSNSIANAILETTESILTYSSNNYKIANDSYTDEMFVKKIEKILSN